MNWAPFFFSFFPKIENVPFNSNKLKNKKGKKQGGKKEEDGLKPAYSLGVVLQHLHSTENHDLCGHNFFKFPYKNHEQKQGCQSLSHLATVVCSPVSKNWQWLKLLLPLPLWWIKAWRINNNLVNIQIIVETGQQGKATPTWGSYCLKICVILELCITKHDCSAKS